jgi:hypothetical protein
LVSFGHVSPPADRWRGRLDRNSSVFRGALAGTAAFLASTIQLRCHRLDGLRSISIRSAKVCQVCHVLCRSEGYSTVWICAVLRSGLRSNQVRLHLHAVWTNSANKDPYETIGVCSSVTVKTPGVETARVETARRDLRLTDGLL